jgi:hypothetical protein
MRVGPDKIMSFNTIGGFLLDDPGCLILTVDSVWGWPDAIAIVLYAAANLPFKEIWVSLKSTA